SVERFRITGFALNTLKTSSCGSTFTLPTATDFVNRRSTWLTRSVYSPFDPYGINCTLRFAALSGVPLRVGNTSAPAGHGAGQFVGYRVVRLNSHAVPPVILVVVSDRNA